VKEWRLRSKQDLYPDGIEFGLLDTGAGSGYCRGIVFAGLLYPEAGAVTVTVTRSGTGQSLRRGTLYRGDISSAYVENVKTEKIRTTSDWAKERILKRLPVGQRETEMMRRKERAGEGRWTNISLVG
jgi:hypothetical protein